MSVLHGQLIPRVPIIFLDVQRLCTLAHFTPDPNTERLGPDTRNDVKQYEMMYTAHRTLLIEICSYARLGRRRDPGKQCLGGCEHASFAQSLRGALRSGEDDGKPWNAV